MQVYCDFNRRCGCDGPSTWTRVGFLNMSDPSMQCPGNWSLYSTPVRACGEGSTPPTGDCWSETFSTYGQRVCGRVLGYQKSTTVAFFCFMDSVESRYFTGVVSLTHGRVGSRRHIWSFVSTLGDAEEVILPTSRTHFCPCSSTTISYYWARMQETICRRRLFL